MAKVIKRLEAHYEVQDLEMGKVYRWRPESIVVECEECGKILTLTLSKSACGKCGADHTAFFEEEGLEARPEVEDKEELYHPWRSLHPYYTPIKGA
jgi:ribosomal protein S27AE